MIRADTIDLQDKTAPTAQDHSQQPQRPAPLGIGPAAPHQQAAIRHVEQERSSEEARLHDAWGHAGDTLQSDPGSDDERTTINHNHTPHNGSMADDAHAEADVDVDEDMDDDDMDKISSSPSISDEEIDFEFVYALHTFVATVEGQANATKGDTMVLLDDSNSYWWLVRIVKDGSIGYLPAEHIETPTERLARLNKHRNIDLSATMLGDTAEKTKNPLKKARRRRNAKTVQFGLPTYVEASDYDYSSDEGEGELFGGPEPKQMQQQQQQASQNADTVSEEGLQVQPLNVNGPRKDANGQPEGEIGNPGDSAKRDDDKSTTSEGNVDRPLDAKVSRNGTLRNTDSFFNDENTETRKITLTPNLLRDDSSTSTTGSRERGPSLESLEKNGFTDKVRKDDKKKEKKPGMLSGLFKRKDKKTKGSLDSVEGDLEKPDETGRVSPQSKSAEESQEQPSTADQATAPTTTLLRQPSKGKLQKSQRNRDDSPQKTKSILKTDSPVQSPLQSETVVDATDGDGANRQTASTMRMVSNGKDESRPTVTEPTTSPEGRTAMKVVNSLNPFPSKTQLNGEPKPEEVKKSKQRVQLDDFDSSSDESNDPFADPDAQPDSSQVPDTENADSLSESPVHVSAVDAQPPQHNLTQEQPRETNPHKPPALTADTSSQETSSPVSTPDNDSPMKTIPEHRSLSTFQTHSGSSPATQSPQSAPPPPPSRLAPTPVRDMDREPSPPVSSSSSVLPAWSDTSLRAYLDDSSEVRDLLLLVHDTTGVVPVSRDHPLMKDLFVQESRTMQSLSSELDALLKGVMDKRLVGSGVAKGGKTGSSSSIGTVRSRSASGGLRTGR